VLGLSGFFFARTYSVSRRCQEFIILGIDPADALHCACAESVGAVRFLQIYDQGSGDYTHERKQWLQKDPDKYLAAVIAHGKKKSRA
jgi:hypothetical protein